MQHICRGARRSSIRFSTRHVRAVPWRLLGGMGLWLGLVGAVQAQANWVPDPAFTATVGNNVLAIAPWVDGERVVIGGGFTTVSGAPHSRLARLNLNANGALDASCAPAPGPNGVVYALAVRGWDSKMLVGGGFSQVDGVARSGIARLHDDCTLDGTFDPGTGTNNVVWAVRMQGLNQVLIGGEFTEVNGVARNHIARLNADGSLDNTFNPNVDGAVNSLAVQADGKILIGGSFNLVGGVVRRNIARLNADGTLDATFAPASASAVQSIALLPGGEVLRAGFPFGGVDAVVRLNAADGASDPAFVPGAGPNGAVRAMAVQADGKILIGGGFTEVDGVARNRIARLNADGSLDGTFDPGTGADDLVYALTLHGDGTVLLGGRFTQVNGQPGTARLARLMPSPAIGPGGPQAIPVDAPWALALLSALLGVAGWRRARRDHY